MLTPEDRRIGDVWALLPSSFFRVQRRSGLNVCLATWCFLARIVAKSELVYAL